MTALLLAALGCTGPREADTAGPPGIDTAVDPALLCPFGAARSDGTRDVHGYLYGDGDTDPLAGATVTACGTSSPSVVTDASGAWTLPLEDREWVVVEQVYAGRVPNRCVFDPAVEGADGAPPYRIGMGSFDVEDFPMAHLGILPEEGATWVDVDALDDVTGQDLAGATIDITAPYDAAVTQDLDGAFVLGNVTNGVYDILFANVPPVPFDIVVTHPDKTVCRVPGTIVGAGNDQLNLSVYCREAE
ncbi:MAG: hypothetical protein ACK4YP_21935 [Myxococcota bacterium]